MIKSTMITAVLVLLMLAVPGSIASIGAQDQGTVAPGTEDVLKVGTVDGSDDVKIERVDPKEMGGFLDNVRLPKPEGRPELAADIAGQPPIEGWDSKLSEMAQKQGFRPGRPPVDIMAMEATRGTDKEPDRDPFNGSKLASSDSVTGTLTFKSVDPQGTLGDYVDWYKMEFKGIDPTVPGISKNVTFKLTYFDSDEITLYETTFDQTQYTTDYLDFMSLFIVYTDPFWGSSMIGGKKFYYDDGDDTDGWIYDGGSPNPDWQDNWTANFETPGNSFGTEDTNGGTGGLTEIGWYYLGITFDWYQTQQATERPDFVIDYSFTVSTANDINNFPNSPSTTAGAPNDLNNATAVRPTMPGRTHSGLNFFDWYRFEGVNQDYIWNMSVWVNVSRTGLSLDEVAINDNWMYVMLVWWGAGRDGKYSTPDDIWTYTFKILYYAVHFVDQQGKPVPYMQNRFTQTGGNNMFLNIFNVNNRTDATAGHPYLKGNARQMFIGLYSEPQMFYQTSTGGLTQVFPNYQVWDQYDIKWSVSEVKPNTAPSVSNIKVTTKNSPEVYINDPTGGYYDTEFTIEATYTDVDGNLPSKMYVVFDGKDNKPNEIQDKEVNPLDQDVTDGKKYKMTITGESLTDFPSPHSIKVFAYDTPGNKYHRSLRSNILYDNNTLRVWDDNPVKLVKTWPGLPVLQEDSTANSPEIVPLEGIDGAFDDPEKRFRGFNIWNPELKAWVYDYEAMNPNDPDNVLVHVNITKDGYWQARLTLGHNEHYSPGVPLLFRAYDDHSEINRSSRLIVNPVNDPPKVSSVKVGSINYEADNTNPLLPVVHLDTQLTFKEDELITFSIIAEDTDKENERSALEYSYEPNPSSPWEGNPQPQVDMTTGVVTYTPTNGDVNKPIPNNKMVFTIDDRGADGDIKLTVYLKVENVNDAPVLSIPAGTRSFQQFTTLAMKPQATDDDRGDVLKFSVNFEDKIGDTPSILDQLPFINPQKTLDWDLNENTGEFWFKLSDQNIWKTATGNQKTVSIVVAFKVTDKAGLSDTKTVTFDLQDVNEEPPAPKKVTSDPPERQEVGKPVIFMVEQVTDPDGDKLYYKWNFGDGFTGEGVNVTHVYTLQGIKTVEVWVEDGQFQTDKYTYRIEITKGSVNPPDDDDDDDDDDVDKKSETPWVLIIGAVVFIVIILLFIVIALVVLRKKPAPPAAQYPYDPALMAYNYQGLPPGAPGQLPPAQPPELPPAPEYAGTELPPVQPEQPLAAPVTPQAAPPQPAQEQMGGTCPSCSAPVDPSWFLCPNCKAPLQ